MIVTICCGPVVRTRTEPKSTDGVVLVSTGAAPKPSGLGLSVNEDPAPVAVSDTVVLPPAGGTTPVQPMSWVPTFGGTAPASSVVNVSVPNGWRNS